MNDTAHYLLAGFGVISGVMLFMFGLGMVLVFVELLQSKMTLNLFERLFNYSGIYVAVLFMLGSVATLLYSVANLLT